MGALDGLLVIAIEQAVAAPICTQRLAAAGARVIKVERAGGETARHYDSAVKGTSAYFAWLNAGKESAVLNLKDAGDLGVLHKMLAQADVLVQNLSPGALDRMGLTADVIAARFPRLITVSITGYGQDTPYADMKAYDMLVQAESGLCAVTGTPDVPSKVGVSVADIATGTAAHAAVLEALIARATTGRGQSIEIAMFDCVADWMTVPLLHYEHSGVETGRYGLSHASIYPYRPFQCKDGAVIIAVQTDQEWDNLCRVAMDRADILEHAEFASNALRVQNRAAVDAMLDPVFADWTMAEATARCTQAGIAWAQYRSIADLATHPALRRKSVTLDTGEAITVPRPAGANTSEPAGTLAKIGQHTDAILAEFG